MGNTCFWGSLGSKILKNTGDASGSGAQDIHSVVGDENQQDAAQKTSCIHVSALRDTHEGMMLEAGPKKGTLEPE